MDQAALKKEVQALTKKEGSGNDRCADCGGPNPQWASLSYAVFICLTCAGDHRGYGVHITFVRSVSMDKWQEDQFRRMKLGGNKAFQAFLDNYAPASVGGYQTGMSKEGKYGCWAADQYKEKLSAELQGEPWSPSSPPPNWVSPLSSNDSRPQSAQGLRKSRTSGRPTTGSSMRQQSASPASFTNSPSPTAGMTDSLSGGFPPQNQKEANENYFASMGSINASRPDNLPPSQGGRYQGFGNTPSPSTNSSHPSYGLSSKATPSLSDFQENPGAALSKGWSLFSSALMGATRTINESVVQPGLERVRDPEFQANVRGYYDEASKRVTLAGSAANSWSKQQLGVDVAESVGGVVDTVKDRIGGGGHEGYGALATHHEGEDWDRYEDVDDDFFHEDSHGSTSQTSAAHASGQAAAASSSNSASTATKADGWDEWKDF